MTADGGNGRRNAVLIGSAIVVVALAGGGWAMFGRGDGTAKSAVAAPAPGRPDVSVETLKKMKPREWMELSAREDLTEDEREKLREAGREVWETRMEEVVNQYFAAKTDEDRNRVLDEQIDEWVKMREDMEQWRKENPDKLNQMEDRWRNPRTPTREERKERFESANMEKQAKTFKYFMAVQARAQSRGLDLSPGSWRRGNEDEKKSDADGADEAADEKAAAEDGADGSTGDPDGDTPQRAPRRSRRTVERDDEGGSGAQ